MTRGSLRVGAVAASLVVGAACAVDRRAADAGLPDAGAADRVEAVLEQVAPGKVVHVVAVDGGGLDTDRDLAGVEPLTPEQEAALRKAFHIEPPPSLAERRREVAAEKRPVWRAVLQLSLAEALPAGSVEGRVLRSSAEAALRRRLTQEKRPTQRARLEYWLAASLPEESPERRGLLRRVATLRWSEMPVAEEDPRTDFFNPTTPARLLLQRRGEWEGSLAEGHLVEPLDAGALALAPPVLEGASEVSCWTMVRQDGGWFWRGLPVRRRDGGAEVPLNRYLPQVPAVLDARSRAVLQVNADRTCTVVEAGCECGECRPLARVSCPFTSR